MAGLLGLVGIAMRMESERQGSGVGMILALRSEIFLEKAGEGDAAHEEAPLTHSNANGQNANGQNAVRDDVTADAVVVKAMHVQGSAFKSGQIKTGDILVSVNGQNVGADNMLAGSLIRGEMGSTVKLGVTREGGDTVEVELTRRYITGHPTNEAPIKAFF
mmetsp:Transcript_3152/g.7499  ORF Transcript_3152/g.7499 Transcript_3152/m.7499 type:complete len:161 (-) Transcript_3152:28-510(-)